MRCGIWVWGRGDRGEKIDVGGGGGGEEVGTQCDTCGVGAV